MKQKFLISEEEKNRILNLHVEATKKNYIFEQIETSLLDKFRSRMYWIYELNNDLLKKYTEGEITAKGEGSYNKTTNTITITNLEIGKFIVGGLIYTEDQWNNRSDTTKYPRVTNVDEKDISQIVLTIKDPEGAFSPLTDNSNTKFYQGYKPYYDIKGSILGNVKFLQNERRWVDLFDGSEDMTEEEFEEEANNIDGTSLDEVTNPSKIIDSQGKDCTSKVSLINDLNVIISRLIQRYENDTFTNKNREQLEPWNCN